MLKRPLFCEACGSVTEHVIDGDQDESGELALCSRCGRLSSVPVENADPPAVPVPNSSPQDSRSR